MLAADGFVLAAAVAGLLGQLAMRKGRECRVSSGGKDRGGEKGRGEREKQTWCISTVTVPPALTAHLPGAADGLALQTTSLLLTLVTGELDLGRRTQEPP